MVIPLVLGSLINTLFPGLLGIGGFTTALFRDGANALIGAFLLCMGAGISFRATPKIFKKGVVITLTKFLVAVGAGYIIGKFSMNSLPGLSFLAVVAAMSNSNGGLYAALTGEYGDESDVGAISVLSINDGPFLTMIALGVSGMATLPVISFIAVLVPLLLGMVLGNLDNDLKDFLGKGGPVLIPFFAFSLGAGIQLKFLYQAGLAGILLGVLTTIFGGIFNILADRITGGSGIAGAAASSTAGNAIATPNAVALADPSMASIAAAATPVVAASTVTTAILTPLLTWWVMKKYRNKDRKEPGKL